MMALALSLSLHILGTWQYAGFLYDGTRYPLPNPDLVLQFTFQDDGIAKLRWWRNGQPGFCERLAEYRLKDNWLWQKVVWVNPDNESSCSSDADMQLGRETWTELIMVEQDLGLKMELDGKDFVYLLEPVALSQHSPQ